MLRTEPGIKIFPACGHIRAYRGSFCWDYGTGASATRCITIRDGRRIVIPGPGAIHAAHDIHGERGSSVYAVEDGVIAHRNTREDPDGGYLLKHVADEEDEYGERRTYFYSHLNEPGFPEPGDHVFAGEIIGAMGSTGNAQGRGVHVHFQAIEQVGRYGVVPVDVYNEMLDALEIQEGVTPSGEAVAVETHLRGLGALEGSLVYRDEGDFVSCHIPEPGEGRALRNSLGWAVAAVAVGGIGYFYLGGKKLLR